MRGRFSRKAGASKRGAGDVPKRRAPPGPGQVVRKRLRPPGERKRISTQMANNAERGVPGGSLIDAAVRILATTATSNRAKVRMAIQYADRALGDINHVIEHGPHWMVQDAADVRRQLVLWKGSLAQILASYKREERS